MYQMKHINVFIYYPIDAKCPFWSIIYPGKSIFFFGQNFCFGSQVIFCSYGPTLPLFQVQITKRSVAAILSSYTV